jgi:hypothetical protein
MPTHYDIVRTACIEANLEILSEEYGCPDCTGEVFYPEEHTSYAQMVFSKCAVCGREDAVATIERPIRLADVLLAMQEFDGTNNTHVTFELVNDQAMYALNLIDRKPFWHLRYDSLEWHRDNAPETVASLADLLKPTA